MSGELTVTILGSGGSPGVPMPACDCSVCRSSAPEDQRTRCSALLSWRGRNILIDPSTDLRQQALREKLQRIDAVLLTHTHADHLHGIDDLRPFNRHVEGPIPIYATPEDIAHLHRVFPYIFDGRLDEGYRPQLTTLPIEGPLTLYGLPIMPVPLEHGSGRSIGFRIGPFAYLTDCSAIPEASRPLLAGVELLVIDALRLRPHITHFNIPQAIEAARAIGARRTLLTHLNHEIDHHRHSAGLPDGFEFAVDGQQLLVALDEAVLESPPVSG